jgi:hypothetical protein
MKRLTHSLRCGCEKHGRRVCLSCIAFTVSFPLEHVVWEKAPGFAWVTHVFGL